MYGIHLQFKQLQLSYGITMDYRSSQKLPVTAFLHTFVAQHKGRGTGEGMLRDLHKSQSGDMEGLIETRGLSGKKGGKSALSTEIHSKILKSHKTFSILQVLYNLLRVLSQNISERKVNASGLIMLLEILLVARCNPK